MSIWFKPISAGELNGRARNTASDHLGIVFTEVGDDYFKATMPVDERTKQPRGLLHGGVSCVLAESLGSTAANYCVDPSKAFCVGMEINANHLFSAKSGQVTGITRPIHIGKRTQVWEIKIHDDNDQLVCISRLTMAVLTIE